MTPAETWFAWHIAMGVATGTATENAAFREEADRLVAEGRAWLDGQVLRPLLPPRLRGHSPLALDEHYRVARATLWLLERGDAPAIDRIAAVAAVRQHYVDSALEILVEAGLVAMKRGSVRAAVTPPRRREPLDWEWLRGLQPPPASAPAPKPEPKPQPNPALASQPKPASAPAPQPEPRPEQKSAPEPQPKLEPKPPPPVRVTSRTMAAAIAKPAPAAALADEDDEDSATLLRRLVHAAEVSAGIAAAPTRVRTPLNSPLQDCQVRLCVVLAGSDRPLLRSEISRLCLSREQLPFLIPALLDGCRRGAFNRVGGAGKSGKGARFSLVDPSVFGVSDESVAAAVEAQRAERERRRDRARRKHELGSAAVPAG